MQNSVTQTAKYSDIIKTCASTVLAGVEPPTHCCACKYASQCLCTLCMNTSGMVFSVPPHKHIEYKVLIWVVLQRCVPKV